MKQRKHIPLSVQVLFLGAMLSLVALSFTINLVAIPYIGTLAVLLIVTLLCALTGFLFWLVRTLENNEECLRIIVESAHDGIVTSDAWGIIERVNTSTVSMFGYRPGQLVGEHFSILLSSAHGAADDEGDFAEFLEREGLAPLGVPHEVHGLRQDGQQFFMDMSVTRAQLGDKVVYTIMVRDITQRVAAQRVLRDARDMLECRVRERTAALEASNHQLELEVDRRRILIEELQVALSEIKTLSGLLPICATCKKVRDDTGYWSQIEVYVREHSEAEFSHGICPQCMEELCPELTETPEKS